MLVFSFLSGSFDITIFLWNLFRLGTITVKHFFQGQHYLHVWSAGSCRRSLHVRRFISRKGATPILLSFSFILRCCFCCCHFPSSYVVVFVVCWLVIIWENFSSDLSSLQDPLLRLQVCCERPDGGALHWAKTGKLKEREACICIFVKSSQKMLQLQEVG